MPLEITEVEWSHLDAQSLRARQRDELVARPRPLPTHPGGARGDRRPARLAGAAAGDRRAAGRGPALYTRSGYTRIENFGHYLDAEHSVCLKKRLGPSPGTDAVRPTGSGSP